LSFTVKRTLHHIVPVAPELCGIFVTPTRDFIVFVQNAIYHLKEVAQNFIDAVRDEDLICFYWVR
jgi:hypothetical protein